MKTIGIEEFAAAMAAQPVDVSGDPSDIEQLAQWARAADAWWHAEGIDPDVLKAWCMSQAEDDIENYIEGRVLLPADYLKAMLAASYHCGFLQAWTLYRTREAERRQS